MTGLSVILPQTDADGAAHMREPSNIRRARAIHGGASETCGLTPQTLATASGNDVLPCGESQAASAVTLLTLPVPPSVNELYANRPGKGRVKTRVYADWQGHAGWRLREQKPQAVPGRVIVLINFERTNAMADVDNRVKATLDLLVKHQVIEDDRFVTAAVIAWSPPANAEMRLAIVPAANLTAQFQLAPDGAHGGWHISAPHKEQEPI